jgi:ribosomal protein L14E/L6E/L27E
VKRRRTNIKHITLLEGSIEIMRGASDEAVMEALELVGKTEEMKVDSKLET